MLKYSALKSEELLALETEFKQFLILNHLHDAEWRELAEKQPEKAQGFIDLFSNIVFEKVYQKAPGLWQKGQDFISIFNFLNEPWELYHFQLSNTLEITALDPTNLLTFLVQNQTSFTLHRGSKKSSPQKAETVYELITKGAHILDQDFLQEFLQHFQVK